jgi:hypothetical protein
MIPRISPRVSWWAAVVAGLLMVHYVAIGNIEWAAWMAFMALLNMACASVWA